MDRIEAALKAAGLRHGDVVRGAHLLSVLTSLLTPAASPERATLARKTTDGSATVATTVGACASGASGRNSR